MCNTVEIACATVCMRACMHVCAYGCGNACTCVCVCSYSPLHLLSNDQVVLSIGNLRKLVVGNTAPITCGFVGKGKYIFSSYFSV